MKALYYDKGLQYVKDYYPTLIGELVEDRDSYC